MKVLISNLIFIILIISTEFSYACENERLLNAIQIQVNIGNSLEKPFVPSPRKYTKFFLYTRQNPQTPQQLVFGNRPSFLNSNFNPKNQIRILVHGYFGQPKSYFNMVIKNAYLKKGDFNVIVFDWSALATYPDYIKVLDLLSIEAKILVNFTKFMNRHFNVLYDNIYLIGFSLGAHLAGYAGRLLSPDKYNTIFLLDPAGPILQQRYPTNHSVIAQSGDAKYVEAIHTEMGLFGYLGRMADADFYPDFGKFQKNCFQSYENLNFSCSHCASVVYFAASINEPNKWLAQPCDSYNDIVQNQRCQCVKYGQQYCNQLVQMGGEPSTFKRGIFYKNVKLHPSLKNKSNQNNLDLNSIFNVLKNNLT